MPPSAPFMCCCRNVKKPPLQEGIRRSTEVGTMVLNMSGKLNGSVNGGSTTIPIKLIPPTPSPSSTPSMLSPQVPLKLEVRKEQYVTQSVVEPVHTQPQQRATDDKMNDELCTARTSTEESVRGHLSMEELVRQVRLEEGLQVTPRNTLSDIEEDVIDVNVGGVPAREFVDMVEAEVEHAKKRNGIVLLTEAMRSQNAKMEELSMDTNHNTIGESVMKLPASRPKRAVFNDYGDISARTNHSARTVISIEEADVIAGNGHIPTVSSVVHASEVSLSSAYPQTHNRAIIRTFSSIPQAVVTVITVAYTWCATFFVLLSEIVWHK